jgi:hypothetical protein
MRGFVYESCGTTAPPELLAGGERIVRSVGERNAIPVAFLAADPQDPGAWLADARAAVGTLLARGQAAI